MRHLRWVLALVVAFGGGLSVGFFRGGPARRVSGEQAAIVASLEHEIRGLRAQVQQRESEMRSLRLRLQILSETENVIAPLIPAAGTGGATWGQESVEQRQLEETAEAQVENVAGAPPETPPEEVVRDRIHQYLRETEGMELRERTTRTRILLDELREFGDLAVTALLRAIEDSEVSRERGAAASLLGALQDPRALPLLQELVENESDLLVRRAAARGLQLLQTPEAIPVMETIVENHQEDRFVRMSAAYGLAQFGEPKGTEILVQIFDEAAEDGRGRFLAFRALTSLNTVDTLPLMRRLITSNAELGYRLGAIQYLSDYGDNEAVPLLLQILASSAMEQPSIVEAAESALSNISRLH